MFLEEEKGQKLLVQPNEAFEEWQKDMEDDKEYIEQVRKDLLDHSVEEDEEPEEIDLTCPCCPFCEQEVEDDEQHTHPEPKRARVQCAKCEGWLNGCATHSAQQGLWDGPNCPYCHGYAFGCVEHNIGARSEEPKVLDLSCPTCSKCEQEYDADVGHTCLDLNGLYGRLAERPLKHFLNPDADSLDTTEEADESDSEGSESN